MTPKAFYHAGIIKKSRLSMGGTSKSESQINLLKNTEYVQLDKRGLEKSKTIWLFSIKIFYYEFELKNLQIFYLVFFSF